MNEELTNDLPQWGAPLGEQAEAASQADAAPDPGLESAEALAPEASAEPAPIEEPASSPAAPAEPAAPAAPAEPSAEPAEPPASAAPPFRIAVSALSDIGCVRTNNEDFYGYDESLGIYVVCDGMGGMASGEVASSRTVAAIMNSFAASAASGLPVSSRLLQAINTANLDVWESGQIPENKGMGTTVVAAALDGDRLILGNVGDSRAYLLQDNRCAQLTVDHSYVNELIRNGTLTIENAHLADLRGMESVITRAVGVGTEVQPDFYSVDLKPGIGVLLATDGLTRYFAEDGIASILAASTFETACSNLIHMAKQRGGVDNVTCLLILALPA
jgi:protein phosphatase